MRKWRYSLSTFPHFLFISFLSIHFQIKSCLILLQNVKYGTFVANVTKNLLYALWENNSGSNSLWESSASCEAWLYVYYLMSCVVYHFVFALLCLHCACKKSKYWKCKAAMGRTDNIVIYSLTWKDINLARRAGGQYQLAPFLKIKKRKYM